MRSRTCAVALIREVVSAAAEQPVGEPLTCRAARDRVEEDAEDDPDEEEPAVPALVLFAALHAIGGLAQLGDSRAELVLDVLVGRDARRKAGHAAAPDMLVVDRASGFVGVPDALAQLLVVESAVDVRFDSAGRVRNLVFRL